MPRQFMTHQFDLFSGSQSKKTVEIPPWQTLPEAARQALAPLLVRLLVDYANGEAVSQQKEAGHDA